MQRFNKLKDFKTWNKQYLREAVFEIVFCSLNKYFKHFYLVLILWSSESSELRIKPFKVTGGLRILVLKLQGLSNVNSSY